VTTSKETEALNHPVLRVLVQGVDQLPLADRVTLLKALVPLVARDLVELRLKGERFYDAVSHPGQGRRSRHVTGERDLEGR
jgi:hypothetical protein